MPRWTLAAPAGRRLYMMPDAGGGPLAGACACACMRVRLHARRRGLAGHACAVFWQRPRQVRLVRQHALVAWHASVAIHAVVARHAMAWCGDAVRCPGSRTAHAAWVVFSKAAQAGRKPNMVHAAHGACTRCEHSLATLPPMRFVVGPCSGQHAACAIARACAFLVLYAIGVQTFDC